MNKRKGDKMGPLFRSSRFYIENGQWYYSARGGLFFGPFNLKADAEKDCINRFYNKRGF